MQHGDHLHYLKIQFPAEKNGSMEVYSFLFDYLPKALKAMGQKDIFLEIERLEGMDDLHTNLDMSVEEIHAIFNKFISSHHLHKKPSLSLEKNRTSLFADIKIAQLEEVLNSYNILFDLFFTDLVIGSNAIGIDMMNGFDNAVLVYSEDKKMLGDFKKEIQKVCSTSVKFENIDAPLPAMKSKYLSRIEQKEKAMARISKTG